MDAQTIVNDAIGRWNAGDHAVGGAMKAPEMLPELANFYVTGKDVDEIVKRLSYTISEGLNRAFERFGDEE